MTVGVLTVLTHGHSGVSATKRRLFGWLALAGRRQQAGPSEEHQAARGCLVIVSLFMLPFGSVYWFFYGFQVIFGIMKAFWGLSYICFRLLWCKFTSYFNEMILLPLVNKCKP